MNTLAEVKSSMSKRAPKQQIRNIISLDSVTAFQHYVCTWFANVATIYLINKSVFSTTIEDLKALYERATGYVSKVMSEKNVDISANVPLPLTANDDRTLFTIGKALDLLYDASRGSVDVVPLPPALSLEFAEYIRIFMPKPSESFLKRKAVYIATDIFALAVLGAQISRAYRLEDEYGYVFISTYNPALVDMEKVNNMARNITGRIIDGEGSRTALVVGIASVLALNIGRNLYRIDGRGIYTYVRITQSGRKTLLASFELLDVTDLAITVMKLGIASPIYNLVTRYPSRREAKDRRTRTVRSFVETLVKAVLIYHTQHNPEELYRAMRFGSTEHIVSELSTYLGDIWSKIYNDLANVRV